MPFDDDKVFRLFAEAYGRAWAGRSDPAAVPPDGSEAPAPAAMVRPKRAAKRAIRVVVKPAL